MRVKLAPNPRTACLAMLLAHVLLASSSRAQVSLPTVVDLAQRNSSAVGIADADVQKATAALAQTHDAYIPNFSIGSNVGYSHGYPTGQPSVGSATMQSLVFSYSQRQYLKAARAGLEAANLALKDAREQVALDASTAYIELDTVNRELAAAQQQESFASELVRIGQQRAEAGVDSDLDLLQTACRSHRAAGRFRPPRPRQHPGDPEHHRGRIVPELARNRRRGSNGTLQAVSSQG